MSKHPAPRRSSKPAPLDPNLLARLEALIEEIAGLDYDDDEDRFNDIISELVNHGESLRDHLTRLASSLNYQQRRAALEALGRLKAPELRPLLLSALSDANWKVQRSAAIALASSPAPEALPHLLPLADHANKALQIAILQAIQAIGAPEHTDIFQRHLTSSDWRVRLTCAEALGAIAAPATLSDLLLRMLDEDEDVRRAVDNALVRLLAPGVSSDDDLLAALEATSEAERQAMLEALLKDGRGKPLTRLTEALQASMSAIVDEEELARVGRVMTAADHLPTLDRAFLRERDLDNLEAMLTKEGNASLILLGESGAGKTALIHELARRLSQRDAGYALLETSTPELMVGTKYIGEWETKLRDLIEKVRRPRRVLLYITNINDLPGAGTTSSNKQNFVTLLAPYLRRGDVTVIGESTAEALQRGLEKDLSAKQLFQTFKVQETTRAETLAILRLALDDSLRTHKRRITALPEVLDLLLDLSGTYYATMAQPGRSVTVLKRVLDHVTQRPDLPPDAPFELHAADVIQGLARFTGLPEVLLNDHLPLDPQDVRRAFEDRVLGQSEAVNALTDLITLVKAGLADPTKPLGVFLFVGPTGVGKTEIAKALASFIFGSDARLLRFDLSEFKEYESFEKLIGGTVYNREEGKLTSKVREQPFSVILLDEIEKAHPNIFDLFLQVFDDGRLTDARGRLADFRHTIIIMTSNIASAIHTGGALGFGDNPDAALASPEGVMREIHRFFRPEFLNRIDRIVVFRPLGAETMRQIARREVGQVLLRSGLLRRRLGVEVEEEVFDLLLSQGFSRAWGARPLKRAVERLLLLPVAREIVQRGPGYGGDTLHVSVDRSTTPPSVAITRRPSSLHLRRDQTADLGLQVLHGTPLEPLHKTVRSWAAAASLAAQALDHLGPTGDDDPLKAQAEALEAQALLPSFWDDPAQAQRGLQRLVHLKELTALRHALRLRLDTLLHDAQTQRGGLKVWAAAFGEALLELYIVET